jgi:hypothetical protein
MYRAMYRARSFCVLALFVASLFAQAVHQGSTTVTTSGVPVQLYVTNPPTMATVCTITANSTNSGTIWIGFDSGVSAANKKGTPLGPPLTAGQPGASYACNPIGNAQSWNLGQIYIDATNSGDGVSFTWK